MKFFLRPKKSKNKLLEEFTGKKILDLSYKQPDIIHDLTKFPWPITENTYDLVICQHLLQHLPDTSTTLEELNRITKPGGKIFIETPHFTRCETYHQPHQRFSFGFFDYFIKGNPFYKTDFHITDKYIHFDDLMFFLGIGFFANRFPSQYEKSLAFIFPATSFQVTLFVDK